jgi:hypothetical protein
MESQDLRAVLTSPLEELQRAIEVKRWELEQVTLELKELQDSRAKLVAVYQLVNELVPAARLPVPTVAPVKASPPVEPSSAGEKSKSDLAGKTVLDSAITILKEHAPDAVHYRELASQAFARGYRSPKKGEDMEVIEKSFWDTLRRAKNEADTPLVFEGDGKFRYEPNKSVSAEDRFADL